MHMRKMVENCRSNCIVILAGGNDLMDCDTVLVVQEVLRLVRDVVKADGAKCIITGSVVPRAARDFVAKTREFDLLIEQGDLTHHHFETDLFTDGTGIQSDYFIWDLCHLNSYGLEKMRELIGFVLESFHESNFSQSRNFSTYTGQRVARWKF